MMTIKKDRAALRLDPSVYSKESLLAAAGALAGRARVFLGKAGGELVVEVRAEKPARSSKGVLLALAGEVLNEALSHQYRQQVIRFNRAASAGVLARAFSSGLHGLAPDPLEELEPQVRLDRQRETEGLLAAARGLLKTDEKA